MRRKTRAGLAALAATSVAVLLAGCLPLNAGGAAQDAFEERVNADYGDWVEAFRTSGLNTLPFMGEAYGSVVLRADTPPDIFAEVYDFVANYRGPGNFEGSGVEANGIGVCVGDPQQGAKQQLRDALQAAGTELTGDWPCPPRPGDAPLAYGGTLEAFDADLAVIRSLGIQTGIELTASVTDPRGSVSGQLDEVPATTAATVFAIDEVSEVLQFDLTDTALTVAISPTADALPAQAAADAAAGPGLVTEVVLGSLDPAQQQRYAELGPVLDELRAIPGVTHVEAAPQSVNLRTLDAQQVTAIHAAALAIPEMADLGFAIEVGEESPTMGGSLYVLPTGGQSQHIDDFAALMMADGVTQVVLKEASPTRERWLSVHADLSIMDVVQLKGIAPTGVEAQFTSVPDDVALRFRIADQLRPADISDWQDAVDLEAFTAAWNAQP